jgi:hypothetical protein
MNNAKMFGCDVFTFIIVDNNGCISSFWCSQTVSRFHDTDLIYSHPREKVSAVNEKLLGVRVSTHFLRARISH